jgi:hypothetical protein
VSSTSTEQRPPAAEAARQHDALLTALGVHEMVERIRVDARFEAELSACDRFGIPHSFFLGGPHVWTEEDRDAAIAFDVVRSMRCPHCGTFADEWVDPRTGLTHGTPPYVTKVVQCWGCSEREEELKDLRGKQERGADVTGLYVQLVRFDPLEDDES